MCQVCVFVHAHLCVLTYLFIDVCLCVYMCVQSEVTSCHQALTETRYKRDVVSPCRLQPLLLGACVCVYVCHISLETPSNPPQADCVDDTHGRVPGVNHG